MTWERPAPPIIASASEWSTDRKLAPPFPAAARRGGATDRVGSRLTFRLISGALKSCAEEELLAGGEQIHCHLVKSGRLHGTSLSSHLLKLYAKVLPPQSALELLNEMPARNIVSWNTVISGLAGRCSGGGSGGAPCFSLLRKMMLEMARPDHVTFLGVLRSCAQSGCASHGEQVHCLVVKLGHSSQKLLSSAMVDMYAKRGLTGHARSLFDEMPIRDLVSWNVMISCYALNHLCGEAFKIFQLMRLEGLRGDMYTFSGLLNASSSSGCLELGEQVHGLVAKTSPSSDAVLGGAVVDMYAKCGDMAAALKSLHSADAESLVAWNSIIAAGAVGEPMKLLRLMLRRAVDPDGLTLSSLLSSCGGSARVNEVLQLHSQMVKRRLEIFPSAGNALTGAYAKCGRIDDAFLAFSLIPIPDLISWTTIISACALHGLGREALQIFEKMLTTGVRPDWIVFLEVLSACSHSGLVEEGLWCFVSMVKEHQIKPRSEHYTCLVDLLGRAGLLHDAGRLLSGVLSADDAPRHLGAFLGACRIHGNSRLAEWAAGLLLRLKSDASVDYLAMGSIYAARGCWGGAERARKMMSIRGKKSPGRSCVE